MPDNLKDRIKKIKEDIAQASATAGRPEDAVRLVIVTKTYPASLLQEILDTGHFDIGENRVQEITEKAPLLKGDKVIHMVGHLQTNKVAKVVPLVDWIQSVDSERVLRKIEENCEKLSRKMNILIQVNTSGEETKSGCGPHEAADLCSKASESKNLEFRGLMTIGPLYGGEKEARKSFIMLRELGRSLADPSQRFELSMGMSADFRWAIEEGSTMVRIGSLILGERAYP